MPMSRYEIRNEYSLADPELYRAADKDDSEAVLEGVAMAGLLGLLRQLGDLAEFAAEIFHDLHEQVITTAARGNSLMIRVQQLEVEVPSIEKAFLSQTDHSSLLYNTGVDWHPKLRMEQNLVTQGDLPRFVMDSYEECRGPPRLFLLDKFDVAGAGACLKRYTDPSFFKVETSAMTGADVQRDTKIRKVKKRAPRCRNGETPEVPSVTHSNFHKLLLAEPVQNGDGKPSRRAKLKRRPHFSPFDSKTGESYMEKFLKTPSPEHQVIHEITGSSPLQLSTIDHNESDLKDLELRSVSPARESGGRKGSPPPDRGENMLNQFVYEIDEVSTDDKICEVPSYSNIETDGISSTLDEDTGEKEITVDGESKIEVCLNGYQSDEVASEVDNYVDAPSTMEPEMDTDSELRVKTDSSSSYISSQQSVSVENEHLPSLSSDSQSTGDMTISDEGNSSSKKEMSNFLSSDSPRISVENTHSRKLSAEGFPSVAIPENAVVDASSYQKTTDEFPVDQLLEPVVFDNTCLGKRTIPWFSKPKSYETASISDDEEKKINMIVDFPCSPSVFDFNSQSGNDSPKSSGEHLVDEPNCESPPRISDTVCHITNNPAAISAYMLHEDDNDPFKNTNSTSNIYNDLSQNRIDTAEMIPSENPLPGELDDDVPKLSENVPADIAHKGDDITSTLSGGEELDNEDSLFLSDASKRSSFIMEASIEKELMETSWTKAETVDAQDHYSDSSIDNQIRSETLISLPTENSPDFLEAGLDAHDRDFIPDEENTVNETPELGNHKSCEDVELQGTGITDDIKPNDFVAPESSYFTPESLENPKRTPDIETKDEIDPNKGVIGLEVAEISSYGDPKSLNEVHLLLDESDSMTDQSETAVTASSVPAVSDNASKENSDLPVTVDDSVEEHIPCVEDSGQDELENGKKSLSGILWESGLVEEDNSSYLSQSRTKSTLVEELDVGEASTSDLPRVFCSTVNNDRPVPNSNLDSGVEYSLGIYDATQIQSPVEQSGLDTDQESSQQSSVEDQVPDATSCSVDFDTEKTTLEKIELPSDHIDQEFLGSVERFSELSSLLPINQQQILDHDDHDGDNNSATSSLGFIFPQSNFFSGTNQINVDELPPLPPLPPVQWRMGKLQHSSSTAAGEIFKHKELFPQEISPSTASSGIISSSLEETNHFLIQVDSETTPKEEKIEKSFSSSEATSMHEKIDLPPKIENEQPQLVMPTSESEVTLPAEENEAANESRAVKLPRPPNPLIESVAQEISPSTASSGIISSSLEETNHFLIQVDSETTPKEEKIEKSSSSSEATSMHEKIDLPPKIENDQRQLVMPTSESEVTLPAEENEAANESRAVKLPRPPNPLIESVASLDKSKLRKVTERVKPQIQKVDERDSILEQIRAKSFNLKPAVASRPTIQGPQTNLKVAAILEKANAIRQAFAGSDEDDEDNWSDS